jgi:hypothetical protein
MVIFLGMKTCRRCGEEKPLEDFYADSRNRDGRQSTCRLCVSEKKREWYSKDPEARRRQKSDYRKANPDQVRATRRRHYEANRERILAESKMRRYGLTEEELNNLIARFNGTCPVCEQEKPLVIDHDHQTGEDRGMLCHECNTRLGWFEAIGVDKVTKYLAACIW